MKVFARPEGHRCLVLSGGGSTVVRDQRGLVKAKFRSFLPGGNNLSKDDTNVAALDCIYNPQVKTYFVLDLIHWDETDYR
jgi:hypothetical protein